MLSFEFNAILISPPQHVQSINGVDVQYEDYATILKAIKSAGNLFTLEVSAEVVG